MFVHPINVLKIQQELKAYQKQYQDFENSPAREEFQNIINYILLQSGDGGLYESVKADPTIEDYLYRDFLNRLNEEGHLETDPAELLDLTSGLATAGGLALAIWVYYKAKSGKVKSLIKKERQISTEIIDEYINLHNKKVELAKLEGRDEPKMEMPALNF